MKYECEIPLLKVQDPDLCRSFGSLGKLLPQLSDKFEELRDFFDYAILDIFPGLLEKEDPRLSLLDCEYFRLDVESNYLRFARELLVGNGGACYWHTEEFKRADMQRYLFLLKMMDRKDELIYTRQFDLKEGHTLYRIEDPELLDFVVRNFLRELIGGTLFFERHGVALLFGYDLSLPLLMEGQKGRDYCREIARSCDLHLR
ncbi:hypothetical protein [Nitratifractor sp.]